MRVGISVDNEENQVYHIVISSHPMLHLDYDHYIDDFLVLDIPNTCWVCVIFFAQVAVSALRGACRGV
jgi:hypothetical protein